MQSLDKMTNVDRALLLHGLFPNEIAPFLKYTRQLCAAIQEDENRNRKEWNVGLFSFDFWLSLIRNTEGIIDRYGKKMESSRRLFADQLFDGYNSLFMSHSLHVFITTQQHANDKFVAMVKILFSNNI